MSINRAVSLHQKKQTKNKQTSAKKWPLSLPLTSRQISTIRSGSRDFITPKSHLQQALLTAAPFCFEICGSPRSFGMDWIKNKQGFKKSLRVEACAFLDVCGWVHSRQRTRERWRRLSKSRVVRGQSSHPPLWTPNVRRECECVCVCVSASLSLRCMAAT